jgi:iron-sulfur cluster assembly protein
MNENSTVTEAAAKGVDIAPAATDEITITAAAAAEIKRQQAKRGTPDAIVRIGIRGGGCTGYSYLFDWIDEPRPSDKVFAAHGVRVCVDPKSLVYLRGTELDFVSSMMGHGFKFNNPNAKGTCGCGESVQF